MSGITTTYDYHAADGQVTYQVAAYDDGTAKLRKSLPGNKWDWQPQVDRVLYRLPEILKADGNRRVFVVQTEAEADRLAAGGAFIATTDRHVQHKDAYAPLANRHVVVISRGTPATSAWENETFRQLKQVAKTITMFAPLPDVKPGQGIVEWLFTRDPQDLINLVKSTGPLYERPAQVEPPKVETPPAAAEPTPEPVAEPEHTPVPAPNPIAEAMARITEMAGYMRPLDWTLAVRGLMGEVAEKLACAE